MKVFISYSHQQKEWVWDRLASVLECAGVEIFIDRTRLEAGREVGPQLDDSQDKADKQILVFSPAYLESDWCRTEMNRALERNKQTGQELIIPLIREDCQTLEPLKTTLHVDLTDDSVEDEWKKLLDACEADLGIPAPYWLQKRDKLREFLRLDQSVNLVLKSRFKWKALLHHLKNPYITAYRIPDFKMIDLRRGTAVTRQGLVECIVSEFGGVANISPGLELAFLDRFIINNGGLCRLELQRMESIINRSDYDIDLFDALCYLLDERKLVLFMISRNPLLNLLPSTDPRFNEVSNLATRCMMVEF